MYKTKNYDICWEAYLLVIFFVDVARAKMDIY